MANGYSRGYNGHSFYPYGNGGTYHPESNTLDYAGNMNTEHSPLRNLQQRMMFEMGSSYATDEYHRECATTSRGHSRHPQNIGVDCNPGTMRHFQASSGRDVNGSCSNVRKRRTPMEWQGNYEHSRSKKQRNMCTPKPRMPSNKVQHKYNTTKPE